MRKTVKYGMAALFCMAAAGALFLYWCAAQLPERFWVQEGQSLSICEMPFITAVRSSDTVSEAAVTNPPSSNNLQIENGTLPGVCLPKPN